MRLKNEGKNEKPMALLAIWISLLAKDDFDGLKKLIENHKNKMCCQ